MKVLQVHDHFRMMAQYNKWANERLYNATNQLDDDVYYAARESFFGSIHNTLNHLLLVDKMWVERIMHGYSQYNNLNHIIHAKREELNPARIKQDDMIIKFIDSLIHTQFDDVVSYASTNGKTNQTPLNQLLTHYFNHQTHHRGQVHDMLSQTDVSPPALDLLFYLRENA